MHWNLSLLSLRLEHSEVMREWFLTGGSNSDFCNIISSNKPTNSCLCWIWNSSQKVRTQLNKWFYKSEWEQNWI